LDEDRAGPELGVRVLGVLLVDGLDGLRLDPGLRRVVDSAGQVAVGVDGGLRLEQACEQPHRFPFSGLLNCRPDTTVTFPVSLRRDLAGQAARALRPGRWPSPGSGMAFPWRYPVPAVQVLRGFPAASFTVAPRLGEDAPPTRAARLLAAFRSRSRIRPHRSHRNIRSDRRSLAFTAPQPEQVFEDG